MSSQLTIIAGPDSIDDYNLQEIYQIAEIKDQHGKPAIYGTRTVGLKSRTSLDTQNSDAGFMGYDFEAIQESLQILSKGGTLADLPQLPSIQMAREIFLHTGLLCATEIMLPHIQLHAIAQSFPHDPFLIWNPSVDQLGWHIYDMALYAQKHGWTVGLKNGKWLGEDYSVAEQANYTGQTSIEKVWSGLADYAKPAPKRVFIQRGCDLPSKGTYRNLPIHYTAMRVKEQHQHEDLEMWFDPSHSYGPKMRDEIVEKTLEALQIQTPQGEYLYTGVLIEVGTAKCDTYQHITVTELKELVDRVSEFRSFRTRS